MVRLLLPVGMNGFLTDSVSQHVEADLAVPGPPHRVTQVFVICSCDVEYRQRDGEAHDALVVTLEPCRRLEDPQRTVLLKAILVLVLKFKKHLLLMNWSEGMSWHLVLWNLLPFPMSFGNVFVFVKFWPTNVYVRALFAVVANNGSACVASF